MMLVFILLLLSNLSFGQSSEPPAPVPVPPCPEGYPTPTNGPCEGEYIHVYGCIKEERITITDIGACDSTGTCGVTFDLEGTRYACKMSYPVKNFKYSVCKEFEERKFFVRKNSSIEDHDYFFNKKDKEDYVNFVREKHSPYPLNFCDKN